VTPLDPLQLGLPHRAPFVFVDAVTEFVPGESARGQKVFAAAEPFFLGHFPGNPLVPGVILTEALAQIAGIAAARAGGGLRLTAIKGMKFFAAVGPEALVLLEARKLGAAGGLWQFAVKASVGEVTVAEGAVVLSES
jgi:3-hydroxyacyl-[acyl-carrier-protein] dehydratase